MTFAPVAEHRQALVGLQAAVPSLRSDTDLLAFGFDLIEQRAQMGEGISIDALMAEAEAPIQAHVTTLLREQPLVAVSGAEFAVLHHSLTENLATSYKYFFKHVLGLLSERFVIPDQPSPTVQDLRERATDIELYQNTQFYEASNPNKSPIFLRMFGSRPLSEYAENGIDVAGLTTEAFERTGRAPRVLDIGASTALMLNQLKASVDFPVQAEGLAPLREPLYPIDGYHYGAAECFPRKLRGRYDVIVSQFSLDYSILPGRALENIGAALTPGGIADLHRKFCLLTYQLSTDECADAIVGLLGCSQERFAPSTAVLDVLVENAQGLQTRTQVARNLEATFEHKPLDTALGIALTEGIVRMRRRGGVDITVVPDAPELDRIRDDAERLSFPSQIRIVKDSAG